MAEKRPLILEGGKIFELPAPDKVQGIQSVEDRLDVVELEKLNKDELLFDNILYDGGRFMEGVNTPTLGPYHEPSYIYMYNGGSSESGGGFINNSSTYGGLSGPQPLIVSELLDFTKSSSNPKRYNNAFHISKITSGAGVGIIRTSASGNVFYGSLLFGKISHQKNMTYRMFVKAELENIYLYTYTSFLPVVKINGIVSPTNNVEIEPSDGWVHLEMTTNADMSTSADYSAPMFLCARPNSVYYVAGLGISKGQCEVDQSQISYGYSDNIKDDVLEISYSGAPDVVIEDQKSAGTHGGSTAENIWQNRDLNTFVRGTPNDICTLTSNTITFSENGWLEWSCPAFQCDRHQTRLFNITDSTPVAFGSSAKSDGADGSISKSFGECEILANKLYKIEHMTRSTKATNGFGQAFASTIEVYTQLKFWKT